MQTALTWLDGEDAGAMRAAFAELWADLPNDDLVFERGLRVFDGLPGAVMRGPAAVRVWLTDPECIRLRDAYRRRSHDLPKTKADYVARAMSVFDNAKLDPKDRLAALRLAVEIEGHVGNKGVAVTVPVTVDNRKVIVRAAPVFRDEAESEQWLASQQQQLIAEAG